MISSAQSQTLVLYHYWRSTSSWRVRWALSHKNISCIYTPVDLLNGESETPAHLARNPMGYVPVLEIQESTRSPIYLCESLAILEWLEEKDSTLPLLPKDPLARAQSRQLAEIINAGTQPLQNLSPQLLHSDDPARRKEWAQHWIRNGLAAYEQIVRTTAGRFSVGDALSFADLCLIPQMYNARRYDVDLNAYPKLLEIESVCLQLPSYQVAAPDRFQPVSTLS